MHALHTIVCLIKGTQEAVTVAACGEVHLETGEPGNKRLTIQCSCVHVMCSRNPQSDLNPQHNVIRKNSPGDSEDQPCLGTIRLGQYKVRLSTYSEITCLIKKCRFLGPIPDLLNQMAKLEICSLSISSEDSDTSYSLR